MYISAVDIVKPPTRDRAEQISRALNWSQTMLLLPPRKYGLKPVGKRIEVQGETYTCLYCRRTHRDEYWNQWLVCSRDCEERTCIEVDANQGGY